MVECGIVCFLCVMHVHCDPKRTGPLRLCCIALSFHNVLSQKSTKCLRRLRAMDSNLIRVPSAAGIRTLLCNVNNKVTLLCTVHVTPEAPDFIPPTVWPPKSPDLNPLDYKMWSVMQEKVYKHHVKDISELRERIVATRDELDQHIIDTAVGQWHTSLHACVKALGGHFEHKL